MGRELKRVPLDFDWPINVIWAGYTMSLCGGMEDYYKEKMCERCAHFQRIMGIKSEKSDKKKGRWHGCPLVDIHEPPKGPGYQLWETTSEGSPQSLVFKTIDELAAWCAKHATTFGDCKASKETWKKMLLEDDVHHKEGNLIFV